MQQKMKTKYLLWDGKLLLRPKLVAIVKKLGLSANLIAHLIMN